MAEQTQTEARPAAATPARTAAPPKPPAGPSDAQMQYAEERNRIKNEQRAAAAKEQEDPFEAGTELADQRAETAAEQSEVQKEDGGGLAEADIMSGHIAETINQPDPGAQKDTTRQARLMIRAAKAMSKHAGLATLLPPADTWGLVGKGDEVVGHYVLVDLDSLEKVVVTERWVIDEDRVFANSQQWPKALMKEDYLQRAAKG